MMLFNRLALSFVFLTCVVSAQQSGSISGTVSDERGRPVAEATVYALPVGLFLASIIPHVSTDTEGHYVFSKLPYGRYSLSAAKPEDNYPPLYEGFYGGSAKLPEVGLSDQNRLVTFNLKLGEKAGVLVGRVTDADTGMPIDAAAKFSCPGSPTRSMSGTGLTNARFRVLIPSNTHIMMTVSKAGYQDWSFTRNGVVAPIILSPGETLNLIIRMKQASAN
jgi:hypothetical protein